MAMFLSRIKKILNLGTKSITANGTYNASTDGYDGYSQVSVNVPTVTPTSITPSNASPAALTANNPVTPTANGYAIESYSNLTPSDSSPATITSGNIYKATAGGKAVASVTSITPSNSSAPPLAANTPYIPTESGYAIKKQKLFSLGSTYKEALQGEDYYFGIAGYIYSTKQNLKTGTFTTSTSATTTVNCGFKPKYLAIEIDGTSSSASHMLWIYNQDTSTSSCYYASASNYPTTSSLPNTSNNRLGSIDSNGFTFNLTTSRARTARYFAIG